MIVRMAVPSTPAIAAATRRYLFHRRLAARPPDLPPVRVGQDTSELRVGVVHVKHFIAEDFFEDRPCRRIVSDDVPINREAAGRRFLGHVQEREQAMVGLAFDATDRRARGRQAEGWLSNSTENDWLAA